MESDIQVYSDTLVELKDRLNRYKQRLEMVRRKPTITDHALVRYLERKHGIDMEALRKAILSDIGATLELGVSSVTIEGIRYVVKNKAVVTVLE